jgi:hypothetical protein
MRSAFGVHALLVLDEFQKCRSSDADATLEPEKRNPRLLYQVVHSSSVLSVTEEKYRYGARANDDVVSKYRFVSVTHVRGP